MSIDDLKIRLLKRGGPICEEAILRIEALENSVKFDMDLFIEQKHRISELEKQLAEASKDADRLDFVISQRTSWYGNDEPNSMGILCWGLLLRNESCGKTMRDAIDVAIKENQHVK